MQRLSLISVRVTSTENFLLVLTFWIHTLSPPPIFGLSVNVAAYVLYELTSYELTSEFGVIPCPVSPLPRGVPAGADELFPSMSCACAVQMVSVYSRLRRERVDLSGVVHQILRGQNHDCPLAKHGAQIQKCARMPSSRRRCIVASAASTLIDSGTGPQPKSRPSK